MANRVMGYVICGYNSVDNLMVSCVQCSGPFYNCLKTRKIDNYIIRFNFSIVSMFTIRYAK